ncbi:MAG TPA: hypothetical protein VHA15_00590 [Burkholderiales bacterium]|nr:hypothetical protein [Burkholderiales bacterium]
MAIAIACAQAQPGECSGATAATANSGTQARQLEPLVSMKSWRVIACGSW